MLEGFRDCTFFVEVEEMFFKVSYDCFSGFNYILLITEKFKGRGRV